MCPACMTSAALLFAGTTSAGGLAAVAVKLIRARWRRPTGPSAGVDTAVRQSPVHTSARPTEAPR
jgi:hypothetical protein